MYQRQAHSFTLLALQLGPVSDGKSAALAKQALDELTSLLLQGGGAVAVNWGNSLLAVFRNSGQQEAAVKTALVLREAVREMNRRARAESGRWLTLSQGISSGAVYDLDERDQSTARHLVGPPVDEAVRLKEAAGPGEILVSQAVCSVVNAQFVLEDLPFSRLSPASQRVNLYRVLAAREEPLNPAAVVYGIDTALRAALVGRDTELLLLQQRMSALVERQGGCTLIVGADGLGKSRLLAELRKWVVGCGWLHDADKLLVGDSPRVLWLETRGLPPHSGRGHNSGSRPGTLMVPLVLGCLRLVDSRRAPLIGEAGWDALCEAIAVRWPKQLAELAPYLANLLGLPVEEKSLSDRLYYLDANTLRARTGRALEFLLERTATQRPVAVVMDDLHWSDSYSLALLSDLVPLSARAPIAWVGTSVMLGAEHPTSRAFQQIQSKLSGNSCLKLELASLSERESATLVDNLLQASHLPDSLLGRILARASGNPFVIEEILRGLVGRQILTLREGGWRVETFSADQDLGLAPAGSVETLIQQRLAQLSEPVQQTAWVAAVIGRFFEKALLGQLLPCSEDELASHLDILEGVSIIRAREEGEYTFHHILTQDAVYHSIPADQLQTLHAQVGELYRQVYAGALTEAYELLAYHYAHSNQPIIGLEFARLAGEKNLSRNGYEAARRYFVQAQALAEKLGNEDVAIDMIMAQAEVKQQVGDLPAAMAGYRVALERAKVRDDVERQIHANQMLAQLMYQQGDRTSTLRFARRAHQLVQQSQPDDPLAGAWNELGLAHQARCDYREAIHCFEQAFAQANQVGDDRGRAFSRLQLGEIYRVLGDGERAVVQHRDLLHWASHLDDRRMQALALSNLAAAYLLLHEVEKAEAAVKEAIQITQVIGLTGMVEPYLYLGQVYLHQGKLSAAWKMATQAFKHANSGDRSETLGLVQRLQAEIVLAAEAAGETLPEAEDPPFYFRASLQTLRAIREVEWARTLQIFGRYLVSNSRQVEGEKFLDQAEGVFERLAIDRIQLTASRQA